MFLPDVNRWFAVAFETHTHHGAAKEWFESVAQSQCTFCRMTQQGFLRLASNPKVLGEDTLSLVDAWRRYDAFLRDPRVVFTEEPNGLELEWRAYTRRRTFSPHLWNDAYLAAFAQVASLELITFDKGFRQFKNLKCTILK
jgi:hypothetical protein